MRKGWIWAALTAAGAASALACLYCVNQSTKDAGHGYSRCDPASNGDGAGNPADMPPDSGAASAADGKATNEKDLTPDGKDGAERAAHGDKTRSGERFYWSEKGGVRHLSPDCVYLSNVPDVQSGTMEQAMAAGKTRLCAKCEAERIAAQSAAAER